MTIIIYAILLAVALFLYYKVRNSNVEREYVQCVEAGGLEDVTAQDLKRRSYYDRKPFMKTRVGKMVDGEKYARLTVKGSCMSERGINEGDVIVAEKISTEDNLLDAIKPNDIVWLYVKDTDLNKIRVFDKWEDGELITYYYKHGKKCQSRLHHKVDQVKGVVRYKVSA